MQPVPSIWDTYMFVYAVADMATVAKFSTSWAFYVLSFTFQRFSCLKQSLQRALCVHS